MMDAKVSVIIPVHNGAATIATAVASVRAQNVPVEIIVIDDGSSDDTPAAMAALAGEDLIAMRQENRGPAGARNAGLTRARAPLIAFLDDDDVWMPGKLLHQIAALEAHPAAALTIGLTAFQSWDGGAWRAVAEPRLHYHLGAMLARRIAFARAGTFDDALRASEDVDWLLRVRDAGMEIVVTREVVQRHRRNGENMTRGKDPRDLQLLEVLQRSLTRRRRTPEARP
jgi:glycosyltransferase involved in cell wall biosynthesis